MIFAAAAVLDFASRAHHRVDRTAPEPGVVNDALVWLGSCRRQPRPARLQHDRHADRDDADPAAFHGAAALCGDEDDPASYMRAGHRWRGRVRCRASSASTCLMYHASAVRGGRCSSSSWLWTTNITPPLSAARRPAVSKRIAYHMQQSLNWGLGAALGTNHRAVRGDRALPLVQQDRRRGRVALRMRAGASSNDEWRPSRLVS